MPKDPQPERPTPMPEPDPLSEALDATGLSLAGACGPNGAPLTNKGRAEAAKLTYEVARMFDAGSGADSEPSHTDERGGGDVSGLV